MEIPETVIVLPTIEKTKPLVELYAVAFVKSPSSSTNKARHVVSKSIPIAHSLIVMSQLKV